MLTTKQKKFVKHVSEGISQTRAAELAGYTGGFGKIACQLMQNPAIISAVHAETSKKFVGDLLPKALRRLDDILSDTSAAPAETKRKTAEFVVRHAKELQEMADARDVASKNPLDMTAAELELFVIRGRVVLKCEQAKRDLGVIDGTAEEVTDNFT